MFQSPKGDSGLCNLSMWVSVSPMWGLVSVPQRGFRSLQLLSKNLPLTRFSSFLLSFPRLCAKLPSISFFTSFSTPESTV